MKKIFVILSLSAIVFVFFFYHNRRYDPIIGKSKYIVFSNAYFHPGEADNNIVLITDKAILRSLRKLYNNELIDACKCGYDYQVHFFDEDNKQLYSRTINSETDFYSNNHTEINNEIQKLINTIKNNPTHYVYNLKISIEFVSDSIIESLKQDGFDSFLLSDQLEQYPSLKLTYCEPYSDERNLDDAEKRFGEITHKIEWNNNLVDSSYTSRTTTHRSKYVNFKTNKISQLYYFSNDTDVDAIIDKINNMRIDYLFAESCSQYYYVQLLNTQNELDTLSFQEKYPFVEEVTKVENGFVYEECGLYD